jgi:hypothetical protein
MDSQIPPPGLSSLLGPFLPALPAASVSTQPASGVLPLLSPILRQRVQLLSSASTEGWLRLLCYDTAKAAKLAELAATGSFEPHPVSGEVEVDWDYDSQIRFRRVDEETLQALVVLADLGLAFQLVYCVGDTEGGGDGWRVGELTVPDNAAPFAQFSGAPSVREAEEQFAQAQSAKQAPQANGRPAVDTNVTIQVEADDEDDGGYWAQYDATPSQTPGVKTPSVDKSTFPPPASNGNASQDAYRRPSADEEYFARYDDVQPAMDNHDPDEAAQQAHIVPPLGLGAGTAASAAPRPAPEDDGEALQRMNAIIHPRPDSSASSNGSGTVAKLEATAGKQEQSEFGVKQHISRSIRSLWLLSRASGIDREEFDRLVKTELDVMAMVEDQD